MATTNFEGHSHEQLLAMIASLNPETVKARATQLTNAAAAIKEIGESLKKHQVKGWEGEAAHKFQDWVSRAGSATLLLGKYSEAGGKWMTEAAQTMVEVKANTPKYDTAAAENLEAARKYHNDPDAQQIGQTAHTKLSTDRQQAIQQLTKLAQSYESSTTQMNRAEVPTFPPPPGAFAPDDRYGGADRARTSGVSSSEGYSGGSAYVSSGSGTGLSPQAGGVPGGLTQLDGSPPAVPATPPVHPPVTPDRHVGVNLDHVATLPDKTLPSAPGLPVGPGPSGPGGGWNPPNGPTPPLTHPPISVPPALGGGQQPFTRPPVGGGKVGGLQVPLPRDTGIVGGRQIPTGGPSAGIPRGTVIGAEGPHAGGRGVPGMMGGGLGGPHGTPGSPATGRRLAMEPGGVVGGRQPAGQPFTQGGSGLVRNGPGAGAMGHGGASAPAPSGRRGAQGGGRPDYLAEDEETWQGNRRVVPPVID
ncbi:WXG100 family type VII secretion target [Streptomyces sp. NBC_00091]|uniref:WXG100 family type VII secretion target n=1 Tax=Streptomyces sp. NBC_00091 TaxID=2975648 RepID=UPI002253A7AC|nr:hypothetical protein [Streptomyces sp. NBC_00091]MCX5378119.1 hypothetical protein [Streptomyces sp. NBC_00091]